MTEVRCLVQRQGGQQVKKQTTLKITNDDGTSETILCYIQQSQLFKVPNRDRWKGRHAIKGKWKWFSSPLPGELEAWRDFNKQVNDFILKGKRTLVQRNEYPSLLKVVNAMLATAYEVAENAEDTRFTYASCLRKFTSHLPCK